MILFLKSLAQFARIIGDFMEVTGFWKIYNATIDLLVHIQLCGIYDPSHLPASLGTCDLSPTAKNSGLYKLLFFIAFQHTEISIQQT
jgi:hypothetical protein